MSFPAAPPIDTLQRIELAEGVEVELHPAGPLVRSLAYLIDLLWMMLMFLCLGVLSEIFESIFGDKIGFGASALMYFVAYWGYHVYFEAGKHAATPGKRSMKLRVVSETGGPANLGAIMLRNLARGADILPFGYFTGLLCCLFTKRFQRLGDLAARTLVVYAAPAEGILRQAPPPLPGTVPRPPPVLLTREERRAIVRFQERSTTWSAARQAELAAHAAGLTKTTPEEGVRQLSSMAVWLRDS